VKLTWLEKLGRWQDALQVYEQSRLNDPRASEFVLGRLRCLAALSEWGQLARASEQVWFALSPSQQAEAAPLVAAARWHCHEWTRMSEATCLIDETSYSGGFYRAILAIYKGEYAEAQRWVDCARTALQPELRAVVGDSYARAHAPLVLAQQLAETEELIAYKQCEAVLRWRRGGWF